MGLEIQCDDDLTLKDQQRREDTEVARRYPDVQPTTALSTGRTIRSCVIGGYGQLDNHPKLNEGLILADDRVEAVDRRFDPLKEVTSAWFGGNGEVRPRPFKSFDDLESKSRIEKRSSGCLEGLERFDRDIADVLDFWCGEGKFAPAGSSAIDASRRRISHREKVVSNKAGGEVRAGRLRDLAHMFGESSPPGLKSTVEFKPYQKVGINWMYLMVSNHKGCLLADDMGELYPLKDKSNLRLTIIIFIIRTR